MSPLLKVDFQRLHPSSKGIPLERVGVKKRAKIRLLLIGIDSKY